MSAKNSPTQHYPNVDANPDFPALEKEVLAAWQREGTFQASVDARPAANEFVFYDGPPFANGLPHYGHLLTGYVKDVFARYQTMRGKKVERRFGWDCHGLPAEMGSEKELGISGRAAITEYGIGKFNEHCRTSVMKYTSEWEDYVNRQARWVDFKNDYKTMDKNFMESVLWAFKQLYDKGLVYEAYRVMPYSWAAETPLSNFETKLDNSYREREDKAITVAFELEKPLSLLPQKVNEYGTEQEVLSYKILAWTTTPWTLPSNLALAVNSEIDYTAIFYNGIYYIFAASKEAEFIKLFDIKNFGAGWTGNPESAGQPSFYFKGSELKGLTYKPLFPYFKEHPNAFKILDGSSFVTDGDGTGIVHMAPGFGEDDQKCCETNGIEVVVPVDGQGKYTDEVFDIDGLSLKGLNVIADTRKDEAEPYTEAQLKKFGLANLRIINYLKQTGQLIKQEDFKHNYPHCWRTDQPLIYRAMPSWYVEVTKFRDRAVEINKTINWIPDHIRDGQMAHMLATAPDWSISRNRFWGTPIPVWRAKSGKVIVIGSIEELEKLSGKKVVDLHRPYIDDITIEKDGETYTRVEDVFDCWFESGSMPFAQVHYPFENKEWFETHFPADFITEYVGQTRGWFNTLIMLSTALFDKAPFKNCICHGVVLDSETGLKYSKRLKNYKDPMEVMDKFGADALRWLMISSPVMRGHDLAVDPEGKFIRDVVRLAIKPIWNAYNFFCLYANADNIVVSPESLVVSENLMDRYILAKCNHAVATIQASLDAYDTPSACDAVMQFFEVLNNWYIRRSKERFWSENNAADPSSLSEEESYAAASKQAAYDTLYTVLVTMCQAAAPLLPLTLDAVYKGLTGGESVHLANFPTPSSFGLTKGSQSIAQDPLVKPKDDKLIAQMDWVQDVCNAALSIRNNAKIRVRQPLHTLQVVGDKQYASDGALQDIICEEVNVKQYRTYQTDDISTYATKKLSINSQVLGKRLPEKMKQILPASKKGEWVQKDGTIEICGEKLLPTEFTLQLEPKPEYANRAQALSTNDALVILDIEITPELKAEGLARDLVRAIQQARKDAGLHVADRIALSVEAAAELKEAIKAHQNYITEQTLTAQMVEQMSGDDCYRTEQLVGDDNITISLKKYSA